MASRGDINLENVQPKLFDNWVKLSIEETIDKTGAFVKLKSKDYFEIGDFPVIDQGDKFISGYINDESLLYQGELPVIIFGDHTRNVKFIDFPFAAGADGTKILKPKSFYNPKFYHYYFKSLSVPDLGYSRHFSILKEIEFPLPPLAEQNRIVTKLDALFTQLETIKTSMAKVPLLLKDFRQQVLTQAVTGKLTEEWRIGKELEDWKEYILLDVIIEKPRNGFSPKAVEYETPVKSLTLSATTSGKFNPLHVKYLEIEAPNLTSHLWLKKDDILIQRSNSLDYVGTAAIYDGTDFDFIYPDIMMKVRANDKILNKFLFYSLSSKTIKEYFKNNASGTAGNMPKINQETVSRTPINLPPLEEQQEIVSRVESLFAKAYVIEKQYETLKAKIDSLPQAILHKAFKGELTQQLDSDGDARELLMEIEGLKVMSGKVSKKQRVKV